jgi:hypothetical protein
MILLIMTCCGLIGGLCFSTSAYALQVAPRASVSVYVASANTTTAYNSGCTQGAADAQSPSQSSEVILDFGTISSLGTGTLLTMSNTFVTFAQLNAYAEQYAYGYYSCTGSVISSTLNLGIGTNNSAYYVSSAGGTLWANSAVLPVKSWIASNLRQISVFGANDMEPSWTSPSSTIAWVQGYSATNVAPLINYGSTDGCPTTTYTNGSCNNGWTQDNIWFISWGNSSSFCLPEIYFSAQSLQWTMISKYASVSKTGKIYFDGPLTEFGASGSYTSIQAWNQFWTNLNSSSNTAINFKFRSDI